MPLSEHVYCVAITCKVTEWVEQRICIRFSIKLEHSSMETTGMIQRATAMGSWWLAFSSQQHALSCIACLVQSFGGKHQITQETQLPYSPDLMPYDFWFSPKIKSSLKGRKFQTIDEIQENMTGQLMATGRTLWGPKVPTLKGTEALLSYVQCFFYLLQ